MSVSFFCLGNGRPSCTSCQHETRTENFGVSGPEDVDYSTCTRGPQCQAHPTSDPSTATPLTASIQQCARCGQEHPDQVFTPFTHPPPHHTHYALCPTNGEPILLRVLTPA